MAAAAFSQYMPQVVKTLQQTLFEKAHANAVEVNLYDARNKSRLAILRFYAGLSDLTIKVHQILTFMETQHYSDRHLAAQVKARYEHLGQMLNQMGHHFMQTSDQRVLTFLLFLDQLNKVFEVDKMSQSDPSFFAKLLAKLKGVEVLDLIDVKTLASTVISLSGMSSLIDLSKWSDLKTPTVGDFAQATHTPKFKVNYKSCESIMTQECIETGLYLLGKDLSRLSMFLDSYKQPINASLVYVADAFKIEWRGDYISETPGDFVTQLSLYDKQLPTLLLFYHCAVQPDPLPTGWKRKGVSPTGRVIFENVTYKKSQTAFPEESSDAYWRVLDPSAEDGLPAGWEEKVEPASGYTYYLNTQTGHTQLARPLNLDSLAAPTPATPQLPPTRDIDNLIPPGWEVLRDPKTGYDVYANRALNITRWTPPSSSSDDDDDTLVGGGDRQRCDSLTAKGQRCKRQVMQGSRQCYQHS